MLQEQTLRVNEMDLHYCLGGDGPPLLLLHGYLGSSEMWDPYLNELTQHFRLIVPDLRGHGHSINPASEFTHRQAALDLYALLDSLGIERTRAIGSSTGGMTLLHMATQQPQRIEAMVVIGATTYYPEQARARIRAMTTPSGRAKRMEEMRRLHPGGEAQIERLFQHFAQFADNYDDMNFTSPYLTTITARTLIVHGDRDEYFPVGIAVEMYEAIPNVALWIVPKAGHGDLLDVAAGATPGPRFPAPALRFLLAGL